MFENHPIKGYLNQPLFEEIEQLLKLSISTPFICLKVLELFDFDFVKSTYINTCTINKNIKDKVWGN